jgi:DNA-binding IclR family transcriptional regulator
MNELAAADRYVVPGLQRGLQLLAQFTRERRELSGAELSRRLDVPRASVFRLLQTLEMMGFVERVGDGAHYKLGLAVLQLGFEYLAAMELTEHGRPVLEALSAATGLSAHLVVRDGREVVFVAKAAGQSSLFNSIQVGARLPAHATVLGRILLINQSAASLRELYVSTPLAAFTPQTPTTLADLKKMIDDIAARGYGISQGGFEAGISTIGAPVFDDRHAVTAAISVTVPASKVDESRQAELIAHVQVAAKRLSQRLSHSPQAAATLAQTLEKSTA